jgi:hypothetical protein
MHTPASSERLVRRTYYTVPNRLPYYVWEKPVPRIADRFINVAVYIYGSLHAAEEGDKFGASGFIVTVPLCEDRDWLAAYVVTNKHVVKDPRKPNSRTPVVRLNRRDGTVECIPTTEDQWKCHEYGDDVAVFQLSLGDWPSFRLADVPISAFVTPELIADEDIGIGDDTVMVGRFVNHEGKQKNSPAVRFGSIAMMNSERIHHEEFDIDQESFLVETRSLPGYSGSAVFIYSPCAMNDMSERRFGKKKEVPMIGGSDPDVEFKIKQHVSSKGPYLLGIDWCHINRNSPVRATNGNPIEGGWYVEENTGMAGVVPAWKIAEVLNCEEFMAARKLESEAHKTRQARSGVSLDNAEPPERTQTTPKGAEIPIPTQEQFLDDLTKASRRIKPE